MPLLKSSHQLVTRGLFSTLRVFSLLFFNFINYLIIGLSLAVLPSYVHDYMGYSIFWAGLVVSLQYLATLFIRPCAGHYADKIGPKYIVIIGLFGCLISGICYLLSSLSVLLPVIALIILCVGRIILGLGQSFVGTGTVLWSISTIGSNYISQIISWNGIASYTALAIGAPLGMWIYNQGGLFLLSSIIIFITSIAIGFALPKKTVKIINGKKISFKILLKKTWRYGLILGLTSCGFGAITTFITLFYTVHCWNRSAFTLTMFNIAFICSRLIFSSSIKRYGSFIILLICYTIEFIGLLLVWLAISPFITQIGAILTGAGFSLIFPGLGVLVMKQVPIQNQGSTLAIFTTFMDLALGLVGPLVGILIKYTDLGSVYLISAILVFIAFLITIFLHLFHNNTQKYYKI